MGDQSSYAFRSPPMPPHVREAVASLSAQGHPVSARAVNRRLRATGPRFMGMSFRDLLPMLRIPPVVSEAEQVIADLDAMTHTCEAAVRDGASAATRQRLIAASDQQWRQGMAVLLRLTAKGADTAALTAAFEALRLARERLILARGIG
jgi:hypothetical protein